MQTLFLLHEHLDADGLQQQHLLCLAMLNFDHDVQVVMTAPVLQKLMASDTLNQSWRALNLYGVDEFLLLNAEPPVACSWPVRTIDHAELERLKSTAGFVS
ncbi:hypothetical protein [Marinicella meishanensis]|uniref:hypothetical protein n=1 Tax=Marinicella meishanensis TaxID=2873263 RepID=UPI001CBB51C9|nr:hypothetical protein [Marinicella sp. NBU2979]